jgi:primosomal protein N' (replication factor Y) (superfamily II helicase)
MAFVEVAVNSGLPQRQSFSYAVPEGMTLQAGDAVFVPFGRRFLQGIVLEVVDVPAFADPKPVDARISDTPVISPERVQLARWIADYYLSPLFAAVALMLPPGFERKPLTFYEPLLTAAETEQQSIPPRQRAVLSHLIEHGRLESRKIDKSLKLSGVSAALSQLYQRGFVARSYGLARPSVRARTTRYVELSAGTSAIERAIEGFASQRKTRLSRSLRLLLDAGGSLPASELRMRAALSLPALAPLADARLIEVQDQPVERDPLLGRSYEPRAAPALTAEQADAFQAIADALSAEPLAQRARSFLLHGVTGSGKTEVYLAALQRTVDLGKRAIVLVPEIALTPQTIRRFAERFPGRVAVLHSGLSQGELFDQWHGIREGRYAVVIGSRSALFAPQPDLGLIVIDEEHEWTYKQQEPAPRYHAREAAETLAALTGAVLILGSATPDVVSYHKALMGEHRLLELRERVRPLRDLSGALVRVSHSKDLPPVEVIDMRDELKSGNRSVFSHSLQLGLFQALERRQQAILFLNRRGSAGFLQCRDCGFVPQCPACAIAFGYHRRSARREDGEIERLLCHQCNRGRRPFERCPMCGGSRLRPMGLGVERVEEAVLELLPGARTLRWDRDVTQGRHAHEQILASFLDARADVLIGTQMVAKGLDLPGVTIVGVVSADVGLHIPDFRSAERTFQLLTQVSGRAGRSAGDNGGPAPGRVVIQTYTPDNYALIAAAQHDYASFFEREVGLRRDEAYPPFVRLARMVYSHTNPEYGLQQAQRMAARLKQDTARRGLPAVDVMGPAPPHVPKWHGRYRWQITVRSPDPVELLRDVDLPEGWFLDIDPASIA